MSAKLSIKESFVLYGLLLATALSFFILGVFVGKNYTRPAPALSQAATEQQSDKEVKPELDFYKQLVKQKKPETSEDKKAESGMKEPAQQQSAKTNPPKDSSAPPVAVVTSKPAVPGQTSADSSSPSVEGAGAYTIQVCAVKGREDAQQIMLRLESKGYTGKLVAPGPGDEYFRIWVGRFSKPEQAKDLEGRLKEDGFPTYLRKLSN